MLPIDNSRATQQVKDNFLDANSLNNIKAMGRDQDPQALKEVAKKFEAIFVQQMLKNMRAANEVFAEDSYFNSNEMQFHQDMYDQQMSLELTSGRGLGLAEALYAQMLRAYGGEQDPSLTPPVLQELPQKSTRESAAEVSALLRERPQNPFAVAPNAKSKTDLLPPLVSPPSGGKTAIAQTPAEFVAALKPYAEKAAAELNVDGDVLLAQAALETGWGRHVIHTERGDNSFNLFNIKANNGWRGDKVNVTTIEFDKGTAHQERADFRRYGSYAESFADYVNFLQTNPRYQQALAVGGDAAAYAEELQKAGYATDPAYADKIKNILTSEPIRTMAQTLVALSSQAKEF